MKNLTLISLLSLAVIANNQGIGHKSIYELAVFNFVHITGLVESAPPSDMKQEDRFWNNWFFIEMQMRLMFSQVDQNPRNNEITLDEVTAWVRNFVPAIPNPLPAQVTEMWNNLIKGFDTSGNNAISWDGRLYYAPQKYKLLLLLLT